MLKSFQLRAARSVTGIEVREIALYLGTSRTTISRWEKSSPSSLTKSKEVFSNSLIFFFKQHNILFPDSNSIMLNSKSESFYSEHLSRFQLRAARSILFLTQENLSQLTNIPKSVINYLETQANNTFINSTNKNIDDLILTRFFKTKGFIFRNNKSITFINK